MSLERLLRPASLAVVGASANPQSLGGRTLANLRHWNGRLHLVNPGHAQIGDRACHPSVSSLPEAVDCAVLAIPANQVEDSVRQCAAAGVGAVIVFASGYAETGQPQDAAAQQRLAGIATQCGMRLVGPNCVGVASHHRQLHAAFAEFAPLTGPNSASASDTGAGTQQRDRPRRIALVSQSGAVALALSQAVGRGVALSHVLTCGNSADVDVADYVRWLADDPACDAIALAYEGLADHARLAAALRTCGARAKPVAVCRYGLSVAGRAAVRHHTGTDPGDPATTPAGGTGAAVVPVIPIERLIETATFLAKAATARASAVAGQCGSGGSGVAILSGSGGTGILAVDAAARAGVPTPQPGADTVAQLRVCLPSFAAPRNPCDATAQATRHPQSMQQAAQALLADTQYAALVIPWGRSHSASLLPAYAELGRRHGKPVCVVWTNPMHNLDAFAAIERDPALALFFSLDACFHAIAGWLRP